MIYSRSFLIQNNNFNMSGNPPRLHRRATRISNDPPKKITFNIKQFKKLLCCAFFDKINDVNQPNNRISRMTNSNNNSSSRKSISENNSNNLKIQQRKSQSSRRGSRRSIRAAINERKEMENLIQAQNNENNLEIEQRNSRMSISRSVKTCI